MIRIFIGTSPGQDDIKAEKVIKYSLEKNTQEELEIIWMRNNNDPNNFFGGFNNSTWWTPFSFLRWAIPEYCNFEGKAIYMDVDQVNFRDISIFYNMDLQGRAAAIRDPFRACVMLMDCEKMKRHVLPVKDIKKGGDFDKVIINSVNKDCIFYDPRWNCLDGENRNIDDIWHLHFTSMPHQPWKPNWAYQTWANHGRRFTPAIHPRKDLVHIWESLLEEAEK